MNYNYDINRQPKKENIRCTRAFISGLLLGALIVIVMFRITSYINRNANTVTGGWVLSETSTEVKEEMPSTINFCQNTVEIADSNGNVEKCDYSIKKSPAGFEDIITIYNFKGKNVELTYSKQPILHVYLYNAKESDLWIADYLYAG